MHQNQIACEFSSFACVHLFSLQFFVFPSRYHMPHFSSWSRFKHHSQSPLKYTCESTGSTQSWSWKCCSATEARRGPLIPFGWGNRWQWATRCRYWEPNFSLLQDQHMCLMDEPSFWAPSSFFIIISWGGWGLFVVTTVFYIFKE